jgi:hypothetical protein
MNTETRLQGDLGGDDPMPTSPDPLSPSRTDLNPSDQPGVDELPENDGETPVDTDQQAARQQNMPDVDVDNAELDEQPNPR